MVVTLDAIAGTIGGGQLEFLAMAEARRLLEGGGRRHSMTVRLGPEIGQCCGGRVELHFSRIDRKVLDRLRHAAERAEADLPDVNIFGAGHTGRALAQALAPLPCRTKLVDTRPETLGSVDARIAAIAAAVPETVVETARSGAAFVTMTHEHFLDFLITAEALKRGDAAYCGMIGSATKRQVFVSWMRDNGYDPDSAARLTCPIGGAEVRDKRPQIIAALTAAEIISALYAGGIDSIRKTSS